MKNDSHCASWMLCISLTLTLGACSSAPVDSTRVLPEWVNTPEVLFPKERYITSVGTGKTLERAAQNARRSMAEGFRSQVVSQSSVAATSKLLEGTDGKNTGNAEERFSQNTEIQTQVTLRGADVRESFVAPDATYALVAIDKLTARSNVLSELMSKERKVTAALDLASSGKTVRYSSLQSARAEFSQYEVLAGEAMSLGVSTGDRARVLSSKLDALQAEFVAHLKDQSLVVRQKSGDAVWAQKLEACLSGRGIPLAAAESENSVTLQVSAVETSVHMAVQGFEKVKVDLMTDWVRASKKESVASTQTESGRTKNAAVQSLLEGLIEDHCTKILERL